MHDPTPPAWNYQKLAKTHNRDNFDCGVPELNQFIQKYARQDQSRDVGVTYVLIQPNDNKVLGFYTLAVGSVEFENFPESFRKKLPRYPVPIAKIGRLARDLSTKGQGIGGLLLMDAFERIVRVAQEMGIYAIEVDAKDEKANQFYLKFGFQALVDDPLHLYIPLQVVRKAVEADVDRS